MRHHQGELRIGLADRGESCYVAKGPSTNHPKRGGRQAPLMQERSRLLGDPPAYPKSTKGNKNKESGKGKAKQKQKQNRERRPPKKQLGRRQSDEYQEGVESELRFVPGDILFRGNDG